MKVFVQRRAGAVVGVFANPQPGYADEAADDGDPEIVAFRNPAASASEGERLIDWLMAEGIIAPGKHIEAKAYVKGGR